MDCDFCLRNPGRGEGAAKEECPRGIDQPLGGVPGGGGAPLLHLECQVINNWDWPLEVSAINKLEKVEEKKPMNV